MRKSIAIALTALTTLAGCSQSLVRFDAGGCGADGTSCGVNQVCLSGACVGCVAGTTCSPTNSCHVGTISCASGAPACIDTTASLADGAPCSGGGTCAAGQCSRCVPGPSCTPANPCHEGLLSCGTPSVCLDTDAGRPAGGSCGANLVCSATGSCVSCAADAGCTGNPGGACVEGVTSCSSGAAACLDRRAIDGGASCGVDRVCDGRGACVGCLEDAGCASNPGGACVVGTTTCSTGAPVCFDTRRVDAGVSCGSGLVCNGSGTCIGCVTGSTCATNPGAPCTVGSVACSSGAPVCLDAQSAAPGLTCGVDRVCTGDGGCTSCQLDAGCAPTANPCVGGSIACGSGGPVCVNTGPRPDGTSCNTGECLQGTCTPGVLSPPGTTNLNTSSIVGRSCADEFLAQVTALTSTTATLAAAPAANCLSAGDEVMLINLQGAPSAVANVGAYELLTLASDVSSTTATFSAPRTRFYGATAGADTNIGTGAAQQRVVLVRVPRYGHLTVPVGSTLTVSAWNGAQGGVLALRASSVSVAGSITVAGLGYLNGPLSNTVSGINPTQAGESITGPGPTQTTANVGGSGGAPAYSGNIIGNTYVSGSAGHADAGQAGFASLVAPGDPGLSYGSGDGTNLTLGSGSGGWFSAGNCGGSYCAGFQNAGGIAVLLGGGSIDITGTLTASGTSSLAAAGGQLLLRANSVTMATGSVTCDGAEGSHNGAFRNRGSVGYVTIFYRDTVTGASIPPANAVRVP